MSCRQLEVIAETHKPANYYPLSLHNSFPGPSTIICALIATFQFPRMRRNNRSREMSREHRLTSKGEELPGNPQPRAAAALWLQRLQSSIHGWRRRSFLAGEQRENCATLDAPRPANSCTDSTDYLTISGFTSLNGLICLHSVLDKAGSQSVFKRT